ncbi:MAG: hypothetical protein AUJ75_00760 [Candidatus Omnitrophica bacterium CG1_02_49_10]|nr:MAG: hypothetical protein AUJ75_00760 [Candidatus Omnitrophica bacterium CG1_02_49_10]
MSLKKTRFWRFFSSIRLAIWLFVIIAGMALIGTLIPQNQEPAFYAERYGRYGHEFLARTGLSGVYSAWWFILSLILFSLNLAVCLCNRFSLKARSLGSTLSHLSVLVIMMGALVGTLYGQKGFIKISEGEEISSFMSLRGHIINLGFSIKLDDFIYTEHIDPKESLSIYSAQKDADCCDQHAPGETCDEEGAPGAGKNHGPIARIPMKIGEEFDIAATGQKIEILRYVPDFVMDDSTKQASTRSAMPNNPAIEVELKGGEGKGHKFWVFARFPNAHGEVDKDLKFIYNWAGRRPEDFISKVTVFKDGGAVMKKDIRVNGPLKFGGFAFFQSSYDSESLKWSGLQVVRDPGVPVVYAGFILLISGLMTIFYVNPLMKRR